MVVEFGSEALPRYVARQLDHTFPLDRAEEDQLAIESVLAEVMVRVEACFSSIQNKYFWCDGKPFFSPLISDQYAMFLYLLANTVHRRLDNRFLATRLYYLNKVLHSLDIYYEVSLPEHFLLVHPVGTVLGRAQYGDFLVVYQGVTVGGNLKLQYPVIGQRVGLFSNCSVIGNSILGDGVLVAARSSVMDSNVPTQSVVSGLYPNNILRPTRRHIEEHFFLTPLGQRTSG